MNMIWIFWIITLLMLMMSLCFIIPWIKSSFGKAALVILVPCFAYGGYGYLGTSFALPFYYSKEMQNTLNEQIKMRRVLAMLQKKEFLLRVRLEENPKDLEARWNLLNLMGIQSYQSKNYPRAIEYWQAALKLMPNKGETDEIRKMIQKLIKSTQ